jgi:hypothetical protein
MKRQSHSFGKEVLVGKKRRIRSGLDSREEHETQKPQFWGRSFGWQKGSFGEEVLVGEEEEILGKKLWLVKRQFWGRSFGWQSHSFGGEEATVLGKKLWLAKTEG